MHGLRAVSMIEKLERTKDPAKRRFLMLSLGENLNNLATSELRSILASPFSPDKLEAVRALADRPRKSLLDDLIKVARDDDSYVQLDAIAALGSYRKDEKSQEAWSTHAPRTWFGSARWQASLAPLPKHRTTEPVNSSATPARHR